MENEQYNKIMAMLPFQAEWCRTYNYEKLKYKQQKARNEKIRYKAKLEAQSQAS